MTDFYLVWKNLFRKKLRLALMMLATAVAFLLYGLIGSLNATFQAADDVSSANRFIVVNKINFTSPLPYAYYNRIKAVDGVVATTHWNWFGAYFQDPKNTFQMFAADQEGLLQVYPEITLPEADKQAFLDNRQGLLVGKQVADQFGWKVGERVSILSNIFYKEDGSSAWEFDIEGIYVGDDPRFNTQSVYFHYDYFNESKASRFGKDFLGLVVILTDSLDINERVVQEIDGQFANSFFETETVAEQAFAAQFVEQQGDVALIITSVIGAAFFVILIIVGNSMALAVKERTAEIAVLKMLGFGQMRICAQVLTESLLLALLGGLLGMGLSALLISGAAAVLPSNFPTPVMTDAIKATSILYMLGLGLATGLIPAVAALRIGLLEAFKKA